jgi:murein DD-endopeptidase MepM/ murein hydrolase activator NlpD
VTLGSLGVPARGQERSDEIAQRLDEIERQRTALEQQESVVRDEIERDSVRRAVLTNELSELQAVLAAAQTRVNAASAGLDAIQKQIDAKHKAIKHAEKMMQRAVRDIRERAKHIYKHGPASFFDMFADIDGFGDLVRRIALVTHVVHEDEREIVEVRRVRKLILASLDELDQLEKEATAQLAVLSRERNRAAAVAGEVEGRRAAVSGELDASYQKLGSIEEQKAQYERETAELKAESDAIAAFLRGQGSGEAKVSPKGMSWPVNGPVTSGYGWREHPVLGGRRFHTGIDIGASTGTLIAAAGDGTVVYAGMKAGYGNTVIIDHGGGIATLYAHQSKIAVDSGVPVTRGQRVGAVGCTGYCTGPHLHFEVRVNGDPVDPMGWLP